jgi:hypothetical protein
LAALFERLEPAFCRRRIPKYTDVGPSIGVAVGFEHSADTKRFVRCRHQCEWTEGRLFVFTRALFRERRHIIGGKRECGFGQIQQDRQDAAFTRSELIDCRSQIDNVN